MTSKDVDSTGKQNPLGLGRPGRRSKKVNAKASTKLGTAKVTAGKNFRFGGSKVVAKEVAFA